MKEDIRRRISWMLTFGAILTAAWILPPAAHRLLRRCPARPDGVPTASAVPSFSRKYGVGCSQCHVAYPLLNDFGRSFKENGYVMGGEDEGVLKSPDGQLRIEKLFPWGVVVRSRPFDNGKGAVSNAGMQNGSSRMSNGFKFQPLNDVDFFVAGGDAAKNISWIGELDANQSSGFSPAMGDLQLGYHPSPYVNFFLARKNFYALDPYQTLSSMQQPMIANRAIDLVQPDQNSLSGNVLTEQTQTGAAYGSLEHDGIGKLFYMAGVTSGNADDSGSSHKNGNFRLAFDTLKGLMIGGFGTFGKEAPATIPATGGNANASASGYSQVQFVRTGVDSMLQAGNLIGRAAFLYAYDSDPRAIGAGLVNNRLRDRAAYAELMYVVKKDGSDVPFLVPMVRENWYTTFNGTRQFNYVSAQLAHYFQENFKAFVEYSLDTKSAPQGVVDPSRVPRGNRVSGQIEVGF